MANAQFQNSAFVSRRFAGKIQTAQNIRISAKEDIAKALSVGVDSYVNSYEAKQGEVAFFGKTSLRFLYSDGSTPVGANYVADFTDRIQNDLISPQTRLTFQAAVIDMQTQTNANTATVTLLIEICAYAYVAEETPCLTGGDMFCKTRTMDVLGNAEISQLTFTVSQQLESKNNISAVLLAESTLCVTDYSYSEGVLRLSGDAVVRFTYLSDGKIVTDALPFAFSEEVEAALASDNIGLTVGARSTRIRLDISENGENNTFTADIGAICTVEARTMRKEEMVDDAYGTDCDFNFTRRRMTTTVPCGNASATKTVEVDVEASEGELLSLVNVGAYVTNCVAFEKQAEIEGVIYATALYGTEEGVEGKRLELPFSQRVDGDVFTPACTCKATAKVSSVQARLGAQLTVTAELRLAAEAFCEEEYNVIVNAEEIPFDKASLPAIEVCLARKGETLWELAKGLHMSEEDLLAVNPEITNPLESDARIVVYNKI